MIQRRELFTNIFSFIFILIIILNSSAASGQEDPDAGTGGAISVSGKSAPIASTMQFTGASTAQIPIVVPPGRIGIGPNLSLTYNSFQKNSCLGIGWLMDMGLIQRSTKRGVSYTGNDFFAMVNGTPVELVARGDWGAGFYGAKIEESFAKYYNTSPNGTPPNGWVVTTKDGAKYYYGQTAASRQHDPANANKVFKWCLDRVEDTNGNYMTVSYTKDQGEIYLDQILYTGSTQGLNPYYSVVFTYETRNDVSVKYTTQFAVTTARRLITIEIKANNILLRKYQLTYQEEGQPVQSILSSVQQFGYDANGQNPAGLPAITLAYKDDDTNAFTRSDLPPQIGNMTWTKDNNVQMCDDFNNDGKEDILKWNRGYPEYTYLYESNGDGTFERIAEPTGVEETYWEKDKTAHLPGDFNGDGEKDIFKWEEDENDNVLLMSNGDHTFTKTNNPQGIGGAGWELNASALLPGDYNGDGKTDLLRWESDGSNNNLYFSNGNGTFQAINLAQTDPNGIGSLGFPNYEVDGDPRTVHLPGDYNGDGKTDILKWQKNGEYNLLLLSNGDGTFQRIVLATQDAQGIGSMGWLYGDDNNTAHLPGDFNGDGLTDVVMWISGGSSYLFLSKGDGTFHKITSPAGIGTMSWWHCDSKQQPNTVFLPADYNGDGRTDILKWQKDGNNHLFLSKGDGSFYAIAHPPAIGDMEWTADGKTAHLHGDFNGDGKEDVFKWQTNGINRLFMWEYTEPLFCLESIDNGQGGKTTFTYQPSSIYENTYLPFVMPTVSSITTEDGLGNAATINYNYSNGLFNVAEREFWGFGLVSQTTPDNNTTYTWFRQDDLYFRGKQYQVDVRNPDYPTNHFLSKTSFLWEKVSLYNGSQFVKLTQKVTQGDGDEDANGNTVSCAFSSQEDYTYNNDTGNPLTAVVSGTDGGETITTTSGWDNYGTWVWRKTSEIVSGSTSGNVRKTEFGYETGTGNLLWKKYYHNIASGLYYQVFMTYDAYGNPATVTDARGNTTTTTYDAATKTYAITQTLPTTNGVSHVLHNQYDLRFGKVITATDENNNSSTTTLDKFGRPIQADRPDGGQATTEYHNYASPTSPQYVVTSVKEDASHTIDAYTYFDGLGRKIQTISFGEDGKSIVSRLYYDQMGRNYLTKGPFFSTGTGYPKTPPSVCPWSQTIFDDHSRPVQVKTQDGTQGIISAYYAYDALSTTVTDPDGGKKTEKKNYLGRLIQVTEYNQVNGSWVQYLTNYTYNAAGDMLTVTNAEGNITTINYDTLGRKTSMSDPDMGDWSYTYDAGGNLLTQTDAILGQDQQNNQTIIFTYDELNRVLTKTYTNSLSPAAKNPAVTYTYDNLVISNGRGRLYSVSNANSTTSITAYDTMGRTLSSSKTIIGNQTPAVTQYTYDLAGKTLTMTYPDNYQVNYLYYAGTGLLQKVEGNSDSREYARLEDYEPSGKTGKLYQEGGSVVTTNTYDEYSGRLLSLKTENPNVLQHKIYSYTPAGDVSQIVDNVKSVTHTYTYDKLHRLISEGGTDTYANLKPAILTNSYDTQNGPIHAVAGVNLNGTDVAIDYEYDANGNLTSGPDFTDMNNVGTRTIEYNADNKPYHVVHNGSGMEMYLYYDGGGGRTKKVVTGGSTTYYFGDHYEIKDEVATKYIFAGSLRVAQITDSDTHYFHKDHLGSSSVMTDDTGTVLEQTDYLPFGETREHSGTEVSNYKFTDQELDPESGLYNYDARMYDPVIGLFTTADIVVPDFSDPQSLNRFAYCRNNPLSYVDPDGHFFVELGIILAHVAIGAAIGAAIGSAFAAITGQDIGQGALTGAITGGFFGGAGGICHVAGISGVTQAGIHVIAGMASGAVNAAVTGGDMGMGIVTGGLSAGVGKFAGGFLDKYNWGVELAGRSIIGGITGGVVAEIYGGNFMDGFVSGAEYAAFGMICNETGKVLIDCLRQEGILPESKPYPTEFWEEFERNRLPGSEIFGFPTSMVGAVATGGLTGGPNAVTSYAQYQATGKFVSQGLTRSGAYIKNFQPSPWFKIGAAGQFLGKASGYVSGAYLAADLAAFIYTTYTFDWEKYR